MSLEILFFTHLVVWIMSGGVNKGKRGSGKEGLGIEKMKEGLLGGSFGIYDEFCSIHVLYYLRRAYRT